MQWHSSVFDSFFLTFEKATAREFVKADGCFDSHHANDLVFLPRRMSADTLIEGILTLPDRKGVEFVIADTAKTNPKAKDQTPESLRVLDGAFWMKSKKAAFSKE